MEKPLVSEIRGDLARCECRAPIEPGSTLVTVHLSCEHLHEGGCVEEISTRRWIHRALPSKLSRRRKRAKPAVAGRLERRVGRRRRHKCGIESGPKPETAALSARPALAGGQRTLNIGDNTGGLPRDHEREPRKCNAHHPRRQAPAPTSANRCGTTTGTDACLTILVQRQPDAQRPPSHTAHNLETAQILDESYAIRGRVHAVVGRGVAITTLMAMPNSLSLTIFLRLCRYHSWLLQPLVGPSRHCAEHQMCRDSDPVARHCEPREQCGKSIEVDEVENQPEDRPDQHRHP